jgi:hypothetical protein
MQKIGFFTKILFCSISFPSQCMVLNHAVCKIGLKKSSFPELPREPFTRPPRRNPEAGASRPAPQQQPPQFTASSSSSPASTAEEAEAFGRRRVQLSRLPPRAVQQQQQAQLPEVDQRTRQPQASSSNSRCHPGTRLSKEDIGPFFRWNLLPLPLPC